jgi:hypothetical protein
VISRICAGVAVVCTLVSPTAARADAVLDWNAIAVTTMASQNPFAQARFGAIVQLAVFEAVNAITGEYEPYLGTIEAPAGASAEAAAIAAAHKVLVNYFGSNMTTLDMLDDARDASLAAIPDGQTKDDGVAVGIAAADAMIAARLNDGSAPPATFAPGPAGPGVWQATPSCPTDPLTGLKVGALLHWRNVKPFGIARALDYLSAPPPALTSGKYKQDLLEAMTMGSSDSTERPDDRATVASFYAVASPTRLVNSAARQVAFAQGRSLSHNAQALALINMAINDALVASFATKYHYNFWRPENAIHAAGLPFVPFITTPCFPSYPSNHASGSSAGVEMLRRAYGAAGHDVILDSPGITGTLAYSIFQKIADDVDDARVYGGIHFRFDQEAGNHLGRAVATDIHQHQLRPANGQN